MTSQALSEYDVISNFTPTRSIKNEIFRNFLFLNQLSSNLAQKLDADSYFWLKMWFWDYFG